MNYEQAQIMVSFARAREREAFAVAFFYPSDETIERHRRAKRELAAQLEKFYPLDL